MDHYTPTKPLDRYLSKLDVWGMAFGCMVGWGVFAMPGNTFLPAAGPAGTVIAMAIGMVIMLVIAGNFSYLMGRSSITGGVYSYTKEAFGRDHAFLSSWFLCLSYLTIVFLNGTAMFFIVRILFSGAAQSGFHYTVAGNTIYLGETIVSVMVLAGIGLLFVVAKPALQRILTVLAVVLATGIAVIAVFCFPSALQNGALTTFGSGPVGRGYAIFSLVILAPWAFVGFEITCFDTAHFRFPVKQSGRILVPAIIVAALSYAAMAVVGVASVPDGFSSWQEYLGALNRMSGVASVPTFYAAESIMGKAGLAIMTVTAVAAILTGIIGGYRAASRVLSTMAEDRILSEKFSETTFSIVFIMVLSIFLSLLGRNTLNWFVDLTSFGAIVGFGYASAAAYKIAKMEGNKWIQVTGVIGTGISVVFVIVQLVPRLSALEAMGSQAFLLLSLWCLLGFVFYWRTVSRSSLTEYSGMSTSGVVLFALLLYSVLMWMGKRLMAGETAEQMKASIIGGGLLLFLIIFIGLAVMLYVQNVVQKKHEAVEREKIRAVESSLAKSQFLFNMSHDIRTPMNAIIGYTNLAQTETDPAVVQEYLTKINLSSQHLLTLINDILEMSRIESGKIELELVPADLCAVFEGMRDLFSEQMKQKHLHFAVHTGQVQHRFVWCDRKNLNRVLLKFNAFERERTSTVSGIEGTGLGMSITKSIVDLMGGTIEVMTAPGSGTEIIIRLKFRLAEEKDIPETERTASEAVSEEEESAGEVDFSTKRLLLVEDNLINMEIANMILTQAGFTVEPAENGKVALDLVRTSEPGYYDAVLMDLQMPVMDGYEATRAIRALDDPALAGIPILAMTANAFKEDVEAVKAAGMQAHIPKPIDVNVLMNTLRSVLK